MNSEKKRSIVTTVGKLLKRHAIDEIPIDPKKLAEKDGISVLYEELEDDISGFLLKKGKQAFIVVNKDHHPNRQRFTIAHERGHHELHLSKERDFFIDKTRAYFRNTDSASGEEILEVEANYFAASLLMPETILETELDKLPKDLGDLDMYRLANKFGVSQQAMEIRLENLGLVSFSKE